MSVILLIHKRATLEEEILSPFPTLSHTLLECDHI